MDKRAQNFCRDTRIAAWTIAALLWALLIAAPFARSQTSAAPMPQPELWYGPLYAGGFLCSFAAGTSSPLATYTDSTAATENNNPVVLDANGSASIWVAQVGYKFILYLGGNGSCPGSGAVVWSQDNVYAIFQQVNSVSITGGSSNLVGALTFAGVANRVEVLNTGNTITFTLPQDIGTSSSVTFYNLTASNQVNFGSLWLTGSFAGEIISPTGAITTGATITATGQVSAAAYYNNSTSTQTIDTSNNAIVNNLTVNGHCTGCGYTGMSTQTVVTGSRALNTVYHNTNATALFVVATVNYTCAGGSGTTAVTDSSSTPTTTVMQSVCNTTVSVTTPLTFFVLPGNYYEVAAASGTTIEYWTEWH
jgi:hypothetical protein